MRPRLPVIIVLVVLACTTTALRSSEADAATITASYESGYRDVVINGYGAAGMGTFRLRDRADSLLALCLEADVSHTKAADAYSPVTNRAQSAELDALLWWLSDQPIIDADTGVAAAALAWYYAGALRTIGVPVWSDGHRGFAPIGPLAPQPWDALPRFSLNHMIGLVAGSTHLDNAERRVVELHRLATGLAGPWRLDADPAGRAFTIVGANGPIAGRPVQITITTPGRDPITTGVTTDANGRGTVDVPPLPDGGLVTATLSAPGVHREWDGGGIQRMATPTSSTLTATFDVAPLTRHVEVRKVSADPTIGVAGARFELRGALGVVAATASSGPDGIANFGPIDPAAHPEPYTVHETASPVGLVAEPAAVAVGAASTDPVHPTTVEVLNEPDRVPVRLRKVLSAPHGPPDRSGFRFLAVRREDGASHELVTGPDGTTEPAEIALGTYDVCETVVPDWAVALIDGGCVALVVDAGTLGEAEVTVDYHNLVPPPLIDTSARDLRDGDQELMPGGVVVDHVRLSRVLPGTTYEVRGEVLAVDPIAATATPLEVTADAVVTADAASAEIDLHFDVATLPPGTYVVVERVLVDGEVVAEHTDPADADQTVEIIAPPPTTTMPSSTTSTTTTSTTTTSTTTTSTTVPTTTSTTIPTVVAPTLPPTGSGAATLLRLGDLGFVIGVGLVVLAGLAPIRRSQAGGGR